MRNILIIDDEKPTLHMFQLLLGTFGYNVLTAENGQQGLEVFIAQRPDIIITDIKMPIMDGIEVLKKVKELAPHVEVVVITGHGDMDLAVKSLNHDATDFIDKPVHRAALKKALDRAEERLKVFFQEQSQVTTRATPDGMSIHIRGNVSSLTVPHLRAAFDTALASESDKVEVQFTKSVSINGAGITALVDCLERCKQRGMDVQLSGLSSNFRSVFAMVGISKLATVVEEDDPDPIESD